MQINRSFSNQGDPRILINSKYTVTVTDITEKGCGMVPKSSRKSYCDARTENVLPESALQAPSGIRI